MGELKMGQYSYSFAVRRGTGNNVEIGNFTSIAEGVIFDGGFNHHTDFVSTFPFNHKIPGLEHLPGHPKLKGDIKIGSDCWLCEDCAIMSGVTIGDGAVIGMKTVVTKDVAPYTVMLGSPMRVHRKRFTDDQIEKLLSIKWWNWDIEKIKANAELIQSKNIDQFIELHYGK
jgi:acetyltransferase-like isoleucine patch superfamily enzyme